MSQEDVQNLRAGYAAFNRRDREGIKAALDPAVTWYPALGLSLKQSSYHGPEAICDLILEEIPSVLEGFEADLIDIEDFGEAVLATVRFRGTSTSSGLPVEQTFFQVHRSRNHKGIEMRSFTSPEDALEAARLSD